MSRNVRVPFAAPSVLAMAALLAACDDTPPIPRNFQTVAACESYYGQGNCETNQGANQTPASNQQGQQQNQQGQQPRQGGGGSSFVYIPGMGGSTAPAPASGLAAGGTAGSSFAPRPGATPAPPMSFAPRAGVSPLASVTRGGMGATAGRAASAS